MWTMNQNKAILPLGRHISEVTAGIQWRGDAAQNLAQEYWRLLLYSVHIVLYAEVFSVTALSEYYTFVQVQCQCKKGGGLMPLEYPVELLIGQGLAKMLIIGL